MWREWWLGETFFCCWVWWVMGRKARKCFGKVGGGWGEQMFVVCDGGGTERDDACGCAFRGGMGR